jgi:hypothetical protein
MDIDISPFVLYQGTCLEQEFLQQVRPIRVTRRPKAGARRESMREKENTNVSGLQSLAQMA